MVGAPGGSGGQVAEVGGLGGLVPAVGAVAGLVGRVLVGVVAAEGVGGSKEGVVGLIRPVAVAAAVAGAGGGTGGLLPAVLEGAQVPGGPETPEDDVPPVAGPAAVATRSGGRDLAREGRVEGVGTTGEVPPALEAGGPPVPRPVVGLPDPGRPEGIRVGGGVLLPLEGGLPRPLPDMAKGGGLFFLFQSAGKNRKLQ